MFGKTIWVPKCQVSSVRQLIVRWKYQLKLITKTREKNVATNENCILRKMGLKFQNSSFNILCKIAFWNQQKWLSKELIIWRGLPTKKDILFDRANLKYDKFHLQENFWLDGTESAGIHHQPAIPIASPLP